MINACTHLVAVASSFLDNPPSELEGIFEHIEESEAKLITELEHLKVNYIRPLMGQEPPLFFRNGTGRDGKKGISGVMAKFFDSKRPTHAKKASHPLGSPSLERLDYHRSKNHAHIMINLFNSLLPIIEAHTSFLLKLKQWQVAFSHNNLNVLTSI
jgi:hypothetical protein